jgi:hypothetical protein
MGMETGLPHSTAEVHSDADAKIAGPVQAEAIMMGA